MDVITDSRGVFGILRNNDRQTYTPIDNRTLQGEDLSYKAVGFLAKILSLPANWKIQVNDLMSRFGMGRFSVLQRLKELQAAGYLIRQREKDESSGRFYWVHIVRETPETIGKIGNSEVVKPADSADSSIVRFSVGEQSIVGESIGGKPAQLINKDRTKERIKKHPLTKEQLVDVSEISFVEEDAPEPEALDLPSSEPTPTESLASSESLEKGAIPAACDKLKPVKSQNSEIAAEDRERYAVKLAVIRVALQSVERAICEISAVEREKVVDDAIAWVSEQKWIESPAGAFVDAIRTRKKSAKVVSEELRGLIDTHKSEIEQFKEWYDLAKRRGHVDHARRDERHPESFTSVMLSDGRFLPWRKAQEAIAVLMAADDEIDSRLKHPV
jgi:predicted transcriptional regulator